MLFDAASPTPTVLDLDSFSGGASDGALPPDLQNGQKTDIQPFLTGCLSSATDRERVNGIATDRDRGSAGSLSIRLETRPMAPIPDTEPDRSRSTEQKEENEEDEEEAEGAHLQGRT